MDEEMIVLELLKYEYDEETIEALKKQSINWIKVLGYLTYHRVAGLVYDKVNRVNVRLLDYPVFFTSYLINQSQAIRGREQDKYIRIISEKLTENDIEHVFLKGAVLNNVIFEPGSRASNDIDVLVKKGDVRLVSEILKEAGFVQGKFDYKNNIVIPFSSEKILLSMETRGEIAPFVRISDTCALKTIDVDVNFSLDWTPNMDENIIDAFLKNRILVKTAYGTMVYSLNNEYNFLELCIHLYKDSMLIDILKKRKILDLYKFVDIYYFLMRYRQEMDFEKLYQLILQFGLEKQTLFALTSVYQLFPDVKSMELDNIINKLQSYSESFNYIFDQYNDSYMMSTSSNLLERIFSYNILLLYHENNTDLKA